MAKVPFNTIFIEHKDGSLEPRQRIRIGGVSIGPGMRFQNTTFSGINFSDPQIKNHDLEIKTKEGITIIVGIY